LIAGLSFGVERALRGSLSDARITTATVRNEALASRLFYSLIESAKLCGIEPRAYLSETAWRAIRAPSRYRATSGSRGKGGGAA